MSRYGRDFSRSRWEEDRPWGRNREEGGYGYGGMRSEGRGRMFSGFSEDSDEMSGFGPGGGSYDEDFEPGYRGRYGGSGMGGYMASGWSGGRGYEAGTEYGGGVMAGDLERAERASRRVRHRRPFRRPRRGGLRRTRRDARPGHG